MLKGRNFKITSGNHFHKPNKTIADILDYDSATSSANKGGETPAKPP